MKKSQVMAAIAFAFALGVVAPVASTSAVVIDGNAQVASDATTALTKAIAAGKVAGGYQGNSAYYDLYTNVRGVMQTQDAAILAEENTQLQDLKDAMVNLGAKAATDITATTYAEAVAEVNELNDRFAAEILTENTQSDRKTALEAILNGLQGQLTASANAIKAKEDAGAAALAGAIVYLDSDYSATGKTYTQVVADAKALPKYTAYANLYNAVAEGDKIVNSSDYYSAQQANAAITAINNAIAVVNGETTPSNTFQILKNADETVIVSGYFPAGAQPVVTPASSNAFGDKKNTVYNIEVWANGAKYTVTSDVTVSIKLPTGYDANKSGIYYINEQGQTVRYNSIVSNGYLMFTTNHFSLYAVVEDGTTPNPDDNQGTTTTPGTNDGKGDGNTSADKNGTPNTGVVAEGADASAKSSVSIMAGVSSFITAAGSALVAIRRGKRA